MIRHALCLFAVFAASPVEAQGGCDEDVILVFDASRSMALTTRINGLDVPRIVEARDALKRALPDISPYRRMGLVVYGPGAGDGCSNNIELKFGPSVDAGGAIVDVVDRVSPDGSTPLAGAVRQAALILQSDGGAGEIVLVTDGQETCKGAPCQLAAELSDTGVKVHIIGFRVRGSAFEWQAGKNFDVRNHQSIARCLADKTGGEYVPTESTDGLVDALRDIIGCPVIG